MSGKRGISELIVFSDRATAHVFAHAAGTLGGGSVTTSGLIKGDREPLRGNEGRGSQSP